MKYVAMLLMMWGCAMVAPCAEPTVEQMKERYESGECSWVDVLTAQENALLKELIGNRELPEIQVEGDNPLAACMQVLLAQGQVSQQDVQKAQDDWRRILQIGVVLRGLQPGEQLAALQQNLAEQRQAQQQLMKAGHGNTLALLMVNAKLAAWFADK